MIICIYSAIRNSLKLTMVDGIALLHKTRSLTSSNQLWPFLIACLFLTMGTPNLCADQLFSETFDGDLSEWNVVYSHFSTAGGVLRGNGDGARGAMFRDATGVAQLRFSFFRTINSGPQNFADHAEVAITTAQQLTPFMSIGGASNAVMFQTDARLDNEFTDTGFFVYGNDESGGSALLSVWDINGQISDNTWYDGIIRLLPDNTAIFGFKSSSDSDYVFSTKHSLPTGFVGSYVGVTAYRVPPRDGATGVVVLDNISAFAIPEPGTVVLGAMALAASGGLMLRRFWRIVY